MRPGGFAVLGAVLAACCALMYLTGDPQTTERATRATLTATGSAWRWPNADVPGYDVEPQSLPSLSPQHWTIDHKGRNQTRRVSPLHSTCFPPTLWGNVSSEPRCGIVINAAVPPQYVSLQEALLDSVLRRAARWTNDARSLVAGFPIVVLACSRVGLNNSFDSRIRVVSVTEGCAAATATASHPARILALSTLLRGFYLPFRYCLILNASVLLADFEGNRRVAPPTMSFFLLDFFDVLVSRLPKLAAEQNEVLISAILTAAAERTGSKALRLASHVASLPHPGMLWLRRGAASDDLLHVWHTLHGSGALCLPLSEASAPSHKHASALLAAIAQESCSLALAMLVSDARTRWVSPWHGGDSRIDVFDPCRFDRYIDRRSPQLIAKGKITDLGAIEV